MRTLNIFHKLGPVRICLVFVLLFFSLSLQAAFAPQPPTNLSTTPGDTTMGLSWSAPSEDGGSAVTDYEVEYSLSSSSLSFSKLYDFSTSTTNNGNVPFNYQLHYNGLFYGMTDRGGANGNGIVYSFDPSDNTFTVLHDFTSSENPTLSSITGAGLVEVGGLIYGTTPRGGASNQGIIFSIDPGTTTFTVEHTFTGVGGGDRPLSRLTAVGNVIYGMTNFSNGGGSGGGLLYSFDTDTDTYATSSLSGVGTNPLTNNLVHISGDLYGATNNGGTNGVGVLFRYNIASSSFSVLHEFNTTDGDGPVFDLVQIGNVLYGVTYTGGTGGLNGGVLYSYDTDTDTFTKLHDFAAATGQNPNGLMAIGNILYGATFYGGANSDGVLYSYDTGTDTYAVEYEFDNIFGEIRSYNPFSNFINISGVLHGVTLNAGIFDYGTLYSFDTSDSTFTLTYLFGDPYNGGKWSYGQLYPFKGKLYGTLNDGGQSFYGSIFSFDPYNETAETLYHFTGYENSNPGFGGFISDGTLLYGLAENDEFGGTGNVFSFDPSDNTITVMHRFATADGTRPKGSLLLYNNLLYGLGYSGGANSRGTIFSIDPSDNTFTKLFDFNTTDGGQPRGTLIEVDGIFYGITQQFGSNSNGTIFSYNPGTDTFTKLHDFATSDGTRPRAGLTHVDGTLYGFTNLGGANSEGTIFSYNIASSTFAKLHDFPTGAGNPEGAPVYINGILYGTTIDGGATDVGTVFSYNLASSTYTVIREMTVSDGAWPYASLTNVGGILYGTSYGSYGSDDFGTIFSLSKSWTSFPHSGTATSTTITGLTNDLLYDFRVSAVNAIGTSTPSDVASATPTSGGGNNAPDTPSSLGPAGYVDGSWATDTTPTLTFTTSDPDADNVTFQIQIDDSSDFSSPVVDYTSASAAAGASSFTVGQAAGSGSYTTGSAGQTLSDASYYWRVRASDGSLTSGYATANSGSIAFQLDGTAPTTGSVTIGTTTTSSIDATISGASDAGSGLATTSYNWAESTTGSTTGATTTTSWSISGLSPNTEYSFTVGVTDVAGNTATTSATSTYTLANAPSSAAASADSSTQITVSWGANSNPGGTEYRVTNTTTGTNSGWITTTSYAATGLDASTAYSFEVVARNSDGIVTSSVTTSATTNAGSSSGGSSSKKSGKPPVSPGLVKKLLNTDPEASLLIGPKKVNAGTLVTVTVITYSSLSTEIKTGGDSVKLYVNGSNKAIPFVADNGNGTYTARYLAEYAGEDVVTATVNGGTIRKDTDKVSDGLLHIEVRPAPGTKREPEPPETDTPPATSTPPTEPEEPPPAPVVIESGLTASCNRVFTWSPERSAFIFRQIGTGEESQIATINAASPWFTDSSPASADEFTYRFLFSDKTEQSVTFDADTMSACIPEEPAVIIEEDIDNDGNDEQIVDGVFQDPDGSSVPLATVEDGILIDTDNDQEPDTYWNLEGGSSSVISAGDRLYITNSSVTEIVQYEPYEERRYNVALLLLAGGNVALAAETVALQPFSLQSNPLVSLRTLKTSKAFDGVVAVGFFSGLLSGIFGILRAPFSVTDLGRALSHFWSGILGLIAFRRRHKPWGTVYDSVTKVPIDPAYVQLFDRAGQVVGEAITDLDGRYGFLVPPGTYTMDVQKTNYKFPSEHLREQERDVMYNNLYFGGPIVIGDGDVVAQNVPLDPVTVDWNQVDKLATGRTTFTKLDPIILMIMEIFFFASFALIIWQFVVTPSMLLGALLAFYAVLLVLRVVYPRPRLHGIVFKDGRPLSYGVVRFYNQHDFEVGHRIIDERGRYIALLPPENAHKPIKMVIEERTGAETFLPIRELTIKARRGGVINARVSV